MAAEQLVHGHRHRPDHQQARKGQPHLHRRTGGDQQVADAFVEAVISDTVVPTKASVIATLSDPEIRHRARESDLDQHIPALGTQHAQHVFQFGLQRGQTGGDVDHDREELIRKAVRMAGPMPIPNQTTRIGTNAALGSALKAVMAG